MSKAPAEQQGVKVMTFKFGKLAFSRSYRQQTVRENIVRFESLFHALAQLPILPNLSATLDADLIRRSIFGTAAIEGNPLSEERVGELLAEPATGLRERAEQEIVNLGKAYSQFAVPPATHKRQPLLVTEKLIREINRVITADIAHEHHSPGLYRNIKVEVDDGAHGGVCRVDQLRGGAGGRGARACCPGALSPWAHPSLRRRQWAHGAPVGSGNPYQRRIQIYPGHPFTSLL